MKQIRVTSEHFVPKGEQGYPDAGMDPADLRRLKQLAGVPVNEDYYQAGGHDPAIDTPNDNDRNLPSPVGSLPRTDAINKRAVEKEKGIKPGSDEWFKLWFAKPELTGEKPIGDAPAERIARDHKKY
jgi:hypothetical protein